MHNTRSNKLNKIHLKLTCKEETRPKSKTTETKQSLVVESAAMVLESLLLFTLSQVDESQRTLKDLVMDATSVMGESFFLYN